jgi:hypothetical protein
MYNREGGAFFAQEIEVQILFTGVLFCLFLIHYFVFLLIVGPMEVASCRHGTAWRTDLQIRQALSNILNKLSRTADKR